MPDQREKASRWDRDTPPPLCEAPRYLRLMADLEDFRDNAKGQPMDERNVQRDLRFWADEIERLCHA